MYISTSDKYIIIAILKMLDYYLSVIKINVIEQQSICIHNLNIKTMYFSFRMPIQAPQWTEFLSCPICRHEFAANLKPPISLGCGHTICKTCLTTLHRKQCPFDQTLITIELDHLPINQALLLLVSQSPANNENANGEPLAISVQKLKPSDLACYSQSKACIEELALYLKPFSNGNVVSFLSRPIQRKLVTLVNCQLVEDEGRLRAIRTARSLGERTVTELILQHQNPQQLSANLWAAVRARGCQFLGPAMQEEVLKLVLLALEDGSALSRKVLVMFVVQRLEPHFPQASKTSIGHVVQLLYRASCFKVSKREGDSSLMQLKEEFRTYEALRREHDAQIVQIATEAGLRIAPDQWSALLYGDTGHKSHMQSIIDKLQTPQSFAQSVQELVIALQRTGDPANLTGLRWHLKNLATIDSTAENSMADWPEVVSALEAVKCVVMGLVDFVQHYGNRKLQEPSVSIHNVKYKISMCRDLALRSTCPRGPNCTFAHSEDELDMYRAKNRKTIGRNSSASQSKDDLSTETIGTGSADSDGSPSTTQSNISVTNTSPLSKPTRIFFVPPNQEIPKRLPKGRNNPIQPFSFASPPPKHQLPSHSQMINGVPNGPPPSLAQNSSPFGSSKNQSNQSIQPTGSHPVDTDSMYLSKMQLNHFVDPTLNHANNLQGNAMLREEINRRSEKIMRQQIQQQQQHKLVPPVYSLLNLPNNNNVRPSMQTQISAKNKDHMRAQLELRRSEILKDIQKIDNGPNINNNNNNIGSISGYNNKMSMSSNPGGSISNYPKDYWENPYMDQLHGHHKMPFGGSAVQPGVSPNSNREFVRSDSILDDDYVPFDVPTTSSKYGPISRQSILGKDNYGHSIHGAVHDTTSMSDWLLKHNHDSAQSTQRPNSGDMHFDASNFRGVLSGYENPSADIRFDLHVNDNPIQHYNNHQDDGNFGDKSSSSSSLSPHAMTRNGKHLLSIELQSIEQILSEQNKVCFHSIFNVCILYFMFFFSRFPRLPVRI